jgi:hypothetical protein
MLLVHRKNSHKRRSIDTSSMSNNKKKSKKLAATQTTILLNDENQDAPSQQGVNELLRKNYPNLINSIDTLPQSILDSQISKFVQELDRKNLPGDELKDICTFIGAFVMSQRCISALAQSDAVGKLINLLGTRTSPSDMLSVLSALCNFGMYPQFQKTFQEKQTKLLDLTFDSKIDLHTSIYAMLCLSNVFRQQCLPTMVGFNKFTIERFGDLLCLAFAKGTRDQCVTLVYILCSFFDMYLASPFSQFKPKQQEFEKRLVKTGTIRTLLDLIDQAPHKNVKEKIFNVLTFLTFDFPAKGLESGILESTIKYIDFNKDPDLRTHGFCIFASTLQNISEQQRLDAFSTGIFDKCLTAMGKYSSLGIHEMNYVLRCLLCLAAYESGKIRIKPYVDKLIQQTHNCMERFVTMSQSRPLADDQSSLIRHGVGFLGSLAEDDNICLKLIEAKLMMYLACVSQWAPERVLSNIFTVLGMMFLKHPERAVIEADKAPVKLVLNITLNKAAAMMKHPDPLVHSNAKMLYATFGKAKGFIKEDLQFNTDESKLKNFNHPDYHTSIEDPSKSKACAFCKKSNAPSRCSRCKSVYYCSPQCQKQHWSAHKKECTPK